MPHPTSIVLDSQENIILDFDDPPIANYQAMRVYYDTLHFLACAVRLEELYLVRGITDDQRPQIPSLQSVFDWFSVSLVNYLRTVSLIGLLNTNGWKSDALSDPVRQRGINAHCRSYVESVVPDVLHWRNKIAAHPAATAPYADDNIATLEATLMTHLVYVRPYWQVGLMKWGVGLDTAEIRAWALTWLYEELAPRYWPELKLQPFPNQVA